MAAPIYLDHASAAPLRDEVREAIAPWAGERFGHPGARGHPIGWAAEAAIEAARAQVADLLGAEPPEIVFTSGGTEADNLAVLGAAGARVGQPRHVIASAVEGLPVLDAVKRLAREGVETTLLPVDRDGLVAADALAAALRDDTVLVAIQAASSEIGTVQDVATLGALCRERGALLHVDATAAAPWMRLALADAPIDLLSITGETLGAPGGIGALYVRRSRPRVRLLPQLVGGAQEGGRRPGFANVLGAVGLGAACAAVDAHGEVDARTARDRRDALHETIRSRVTDVALVGHASARLPNHLALEVRGVEGESLLVGAPQVAMATGSACSSATLETSHVLAAIGLDRARASTVVRLTTGAETTADEIARAADVLVEAVARLRSFGATSGGA
ncbi:MAG: cysteine desulfurase [Planctomycetes bacterium]|nr:cysteine desulfurase [Planctomycetota bacterium]MCB9829400.1 cysteine desulfurase [Planctomycetota bacterium]